MATTKMTIEDSDVRQMAYKAETEGFGQGITIFADKKETGLRLQMQGRSATWVVRFRDTSVAIGSVYPENDRRLTALSKVRELARAVRAMLADNGEDTNHVKAFLAVYYGNSKGKGDVRKAAAELVEREEAARKKAEEEAAGPKPWTLRECVEITIAEKSLKDAKDHIGKKTIKDYRNTFDRLDFAPLMDLPVTKITKGAVEQVRNAVRLNVGPRPATKVVTYFRAVMTYCLQNHADAGLSGDPWWLMLNAPYKPTVRKRRPEIVALVKTMILAEEYLDKPLPGRVEGDETPGVGYATLAGLWWVVLTCQRSGASMQLLSHDVVEDKEPGWMLACWAEDVMKAGIAHALPIRNDAWALIDKFRQKARYAEADHDWAFPSEQKKGKVHVSASGVYRILYRLAGRDKPTPQKAHIPKPPVEGKKKRKPREEVKRPVRPRTKRRDLLAENDIPWWSLHDVRKSLTKAMDEAGIPGGASAVLAHEIKETEAMAVTLTERQREDFRRRRQAKVTILAYGGAQQIGLKKEAMNVWTDLILDEYAHQKCLKAAGGEVDSEAA
ncbi:hypothetical protein HGK82_00655 [Ochrobactrum sp. MT180101]|nr:hypothetical protein HGK82_00655 [Ochrobactrum sp. MT180101]